MGGDLRGVAEPPSDFWGQLSAQHERELRSFGFHTVKRHQALRYFTWRWRWRSIARSEQLRFLLSHTSPLAWLRAISGPESSDDAWHGVDWSRRERRLYTFAVRLLWDYACRHGDPRVISLAEPSRGAPLPIYAGGRLISQDLANSALEVGSMCLEHPSSFLEVGAGYGRTAYALLKLFPDARYTIIDIEPALSISRWYLEGLFEPQRLRFLYPEEATEIDDRSIDVGISISSLHEMTKRNVESYLRLFDRVAKAVYLKQWTSWYNPMDRIRMTFADYPIPQRWETVFLRSARVQTTFTEGMWTIRDE